VSGVVQADAAPLLAYLICYFDRVNIGFAMMIKLR
jgi:hypothetical protein